MFYDRLAFPDLPIGHGSPFLLSSPFAGAILHVIRTFHDPLFRQAWNRLHSDLQQPFGTRKFVVALLYMLGDLMKQFGHWMNFQSPELELGDAYVLRPGFDSLCVINCERYGGNTRFKVVMDTWNVDFDSIFSVLALQQPPSGKLALIVPAPSYLLTAAGGNLKRGDDVPGEGVAGAAASDSASRTAAKRGRKGQQDDSRKRPASNVPGGGADHRVSEGKSASVPFFVWVASNPPRPATNGHFGKWLANWKRAEASQNPRIPTIRGENPCFLYMTKGCVCTGHYTGGPCLRKHIECPAPGDTTDYVKADFQSVLEFLKKPSIRPIIQLTPEAEAFLAKFESS
jgi:hypothetical protein